MPNLSKKNRNKSNLWFKHKNPLIDSILGGLPDGVIVTDLSNQVTHWNQMLCTMFLFQSTDMQGVDCIAVVNKISTMIKNPTDIITIFDDVTSKLQKKKVLIYLQTGGIYEIQGQPFYISGISSGFVWVFHNVTSQMYDKQILAEKSSLVLSQNELLAAAYSRLEDQAAELEMQNADMIQAQDELRNRLQSEWKIILSKLGRRERQILAMIGQFQDNKEIADSLFISQRTVETHRINIKRKLGSSTTADFMEAAYVAKKCFFAE